MLFVVVVAVMANLSEVETATLNVAGEAKHVCEVGDVAILVRHPCPGMVRRGRTRPTLSPTH
jgi:hypothetical protein